MIRLAGGFRILVAGVILAPCLCSNACQAQWEPDPWDTPRQTAEELSKQAPDHIAALTKRMEKGVCQCAPKVNVNWSNFTAPNFKYLSYKALGRGVKGLEAICADAQNRVQLCAELKFIDIDFGPDSAVSLRTGDTLYLRNAIGQVPSSADVETTVRSGLRLSKPEKDKKEKSGEKSR